MISRTFGMIALLAVAALAGCIGDDGDAQSADPTDTMPPGGNTTTSPTPTSTSGGGNNTTFFSPPEANLTADPENGSAPLAVNFTIDATDRDGDLAGWELSFGDGNATDGTEFPADASYEYPSEGNFSAVLIVTDSTGQNDTVNLTVAVEAGGNMSFVYEGDVSRDCFQCSDIGTDFCVGRQIDSNGSDCVWFELPEEAAGLPFIANSTGGDPDLRFYEECVSGATSSSFAEDGPESGEVPEETGCVMMWEYSDAPSTITLTIG